MKQGLEKVIRLVVGGVQIYMAFVGVGLVAIGALFAWQLLSAGGTRVTFAAPSKPWALTIKESCFHGPCYKYPTLTVGRGWFTSRDERQCDAHGMDTSRVLFKTVHSIAWSEHETVVDWTAGAPPQSGRIDLLEHCYRTAVFDDRPSLISLRFKEHCLAGRCRRSVEWVESAGGITIRTPCRVTATGNADVFTLPASAVGQVSVELDAKARQAKWSSSNTGQTGVVAFASDCDVSRQTRRPSPA